MLVILKMKLNTVCQRIRLNVNPNINITAVTNVNIMSCTLAVLLLFRKEALVKACWDHVGINAVS